MGEQPDHLRICNEVLELVTTLAVGGGRIVTMELRSLPGADSLNEALAACLEAVVDRRNGKVYPAAWWHIDPVPLDGEPGPAPFPFVDEWLFTEPWARALWYATNWRDVAIEGANGGFLLSATFDD